MRLGAFLVLALLLSQSAHAVDCGEIAGWVGVPLCQEVTDDIAVPDVVGEVSSAAADTVLEGVGLDLGTATAICSAVTANEVIDQSPTAGVLVDPGSLVNVSTSTGVACVGGQRLILDINIGIEK